MRSFLSVKAVGRCAVAVAAIAGSVAMFGAVTKKSYFTTHDKAYYADPAVLEYIQPGLVFSIVSANIASDGTITVDYKITDPSGAALDIAGVTTPGAVSPRYVLAYIPKGQTQFKSYFYTNSTNATSGFVSTRVTGDTTGTLKTVALG